MLRAQLVFRAVVPLALALGSTATAGARGDGPRPALVERGLAAYAAAQAEGRIRNPVLTLIDYSLPSSQRRLWVFEPESKRVLFREFVAHGRGSADPDRPAGDNRNLPPKFHVFFLEGIGPYACRVQEAHRRWSVGFVQKRHSARAACRRIADNSVSRLFQPPLGNSLM